MPHTKRPELRYDRASAQELIGVWDTAMTDLLSAVESAGPAGWDRPTPCPGWSVGDIVAHINFLERFLLKRWDPPHEPDWDALPHITDDFGRITEIPVDLRRSWTRDAVLAEFRQARQDRLAQLRAGTQDLTAEVDGPFGVPWPLDRVLRTRIFDIWVHEQDIRAALDNQEHWDSAPAWVSAAQLTTALPVVWARNTEAPPGTSCEVAVTGPGMQFTARVECGADNRGRFAPSEDVSPATVRVRLGWPDLVRLMCGRGTPDSVAADGDPELVRSLLAHMSVTP